MKTIKEHLSELQSPYKEQALANRYPECDNIEEDSIIGALLSAFMWCSSPEGSDYWKKFCDSLSHENND